MIIINNNNKIIKINKRVRILCNDNNIFLNNDKWMLFLCCLYLLRGLIGLSSHVDYTTMMMKKKTI